MIKKVILLVALFLSFNSVFSIDNNLYMSIPSNQSIYCFFLTFPQDLGITYLREDTIIKIIADENSWFINKYIESGIAGGVEVKMPICIRVDDKSSGDFNVYKLEISSEDLKINREIKGGFCISDKKDIEFNYDNVSNVCDILNKNADIVDISFDEDVSYAKPGEEIEKTIYVTSYASVYAVVKLNTDLENTFRESRLRLGSGTKSKKFIIKVPEKNGTYTGIVRVKIEGCDLQACTKERSFTIIASEEKERTDIVVSIAPRSINVRSDQKNVKFDLIITNYMNETELNISTNSELTIDPESTSIILEKNERKIVSFTVSNYKDEEVYEIEFKIRGRNIFKSVKAYLSVGELNSDIDRIADDLTKDADDSIKKAVFDAINDYRRKRMEKNYGDDIKDYMDIREELTRFEEEKTTEKAKERKTLRRTKKEKKEGFNFFFLLPIIIIAIFVVFIFLFKKSKVQGELGIDEYGL